MPHSREHRSLGAAGETVRTFFALWPDTAVRDALAGLAHEVASEADGRVSATENLHLTLAFLGEVASPRIAVLQAIGAAAASAVPAFGLTLDRVGMFRGSEIAWAGASTVPAALALLVSELGDAVAAQGFALDPRPFQVHVTLARRCRKPPSVSRAVSIAWPVARLVLNASKLAPHGPRYRELGAWPLGQRTPDGQAA